MGMILFIFGWMALVTLFLSYGRTQNKEWAWTVGLILQGALVGFLMSIGGIW